MTAYLDVGVRQHTQGSELGPDATLLDAAELRVRRGLGVRIDPDAAALDAVGDALSLREVGAEDGGAEAGLGVVGAPDHLVQVGVGEAGHYGTERFVGHDERVVRRVVDDGRLHEETGGAGDLVGAEGEFVALVFGVLEEGLDFFVLHLVLDWAEHDAFFVRVAYFEALGYAGEGFEEGLVDRLVDVDALGVDADLA